MHEFNPNRAPDSEYRPGELKWLVVGNHCRLLDPRRTPMKVIDVDMATGMFCVEIQAFEDKGAVWEIPFERVVGYQFERGALQADEASVSAYEEVVDRLDRNTTVTVSEDSRLTTVAKLDRLERECRTWLTRHSSFFANGDRLDTSQIEGPRELANDLQRWMEHRGRAEMEASFSEQFVRNPYSGELVKGHRIVIAKLGLVPYIGGVVRNESLFDEPWDTQARADHILSRLAFIRAVLKRVKRDRIVVYRGLCCDGPPEPPINNTFVSTSTNIRVAISCSGEADPERIGVLYRQAVPVERVFMSYLETAQMNERYKEAEVVLLFDGNNRVF